MRRALASEDFSPSRKSADLYVDSSPQWSGQELLASSWEIAGFEEDGTLSYFSRQMLPLVQIGSHHLSCRGKLYCLIHQLWLMGGPSWAIFQRILSRVVGVCTDMGVERLLSDSEDMAAEYFRLNGLCLPHDLPVRHRTFDVSLSSPGWNHVLDTLLRRMVGSQIWWPRFLKQLKSLARMTRTHRETIVRELKASGNVAAAEIARTAKLPHFVNWRWGTLLFAVQAGQVIADILRPCWGELGFHKKARDQTLAKNVQSCLEDPDWPLLAKQVEHVAAVFDRLTLWGCACPCHEAPVFLSAACLSMT